MAVWIYVWDFKLIPLILVSLCQYQAVFMAVDL